MQTIQQPADEVRIEMAPSTNGLAPAKWTVRRDGRILFGPASLGACVEFAENAEHIPKR